MKKTEIELAKLFEEQISFIFEESKKLPNYGQSHPTFLARPRSADTFEKIRLTFSGLKGDITVESFKSFGNAHLINFGEDSKIVIIYAKSEADFKWLYDYHSYTSSIIIGKMLKKIGLKYSEYGLQYLQHDLRENHQAVIGSIDITKDFSKVLEILELDEKVFRDGFKTIDEFFEFIIKSPYLKLEKFINKEKEQKTFLLQKFEEYLILNKVENKNPKSLEFDRVKELFPEIDFETKKAELLERAEEKKRIVDKLNGRVILDMIPEFEPKQIGVALGQFKYSFPSTEDYTEFMITHSKEEVFSKFKEVNQLV